MSKKKPTPAMVYAAWLLLSDYVPFGGLVAGYNGMRVDRAEKLLLLSESHPTRAAAVYAVAQLVIAEDIAAGGVAPSGWPGEYPLQVQTARASAAQK